MTDVANSLFTFMASRLQQSFVNLNCQQLLTMPNPVTTQTDGNGVVTEASFNTKGNGNGQGNGMPTPTTSAPNCTVDGQAINGCTGSVTINGQTCTLSFANNTVAINCPTQQ